MSDDASASAPARPSIIQHAIHLPMWHRRLLSLAILLTAVGGSGQIVSSISASNQTPSVNVAPTNESRAVVNTSATPAPEQASEPTITQRLSPWMTKFGLAFIGGFIIGWLFRAFLKITSMFAAIVMAILFGLSYFRIVNIDLSTAQKEYETSMAWLTDQSMQAAKALLAHLPGSVSSFAGMFIGFRRR